MPKATSRKDKRMERAFVHSHPYQRVSNTSPMNHPQVPYATKRDPAFGSNVLPLCGYDSNCRPSGAGTSLVDRVPSTTQQEWGHLSHEAYGSNGDYSPTLPEPPEPPERRIMNERLGTAIEEAARRTGHLQILEQTFVGRGLERALCQRLFQIRETLDIARQNLQLLTSLRESAGGLEISDLGFLLNSIILD
ncbi:hypothetical protein BJY00DRAFT_110290 [Aspergillus carlsbadensis]|nr:hypothetical protein BJY00DRAFT_110290 [Aspergillus carlsbadensis]